MITVVTTENAAFEYNANAYPGMSLAEACNQAQIDTINAINDFQMNLLLSEHAYLYENGHEISYVDEAEDGTTVVNEKGRNVKERLINLVQSIANTISNAFDKLIGWVLERVADVTEFFAKNGISKGAAAKAVDMFEKLEPDITVKQTDVDYPAFIHDVNENLRKEFQDGYDEKIERANYIKGEHDQKVTVEMAKDAKNIVYSPRGTIISDIVKHRNKVNAMLREVKKNIKTGKDVDDNIDVIKEQLKINSKNVTESIAVYHAYINNYVRVIRAVVGNKEIRQTLRNVAMGHAGYKVGKAVGTVGYGVATAKDKVASKFKRNKKEEAAAPEEKVEESAVYDGKFFRVDD